MAKILFDFFLLQVFWFRSNSVQSFLHIRMCESCVLICLFSTFWQFQFSISQPFELHIFIRFSSTSHCNVHIKRGSWFHWICISWMFFCESAYSVIVFGVSIVYTMDSELFNFHHNHAIWWILKIFCRVFLQVSVCQIFRFFTYKNKAKINTHVSSTLYNFRISYVNIKFIVNYNKNKSFYWKKSEIPTF